VAYLPAEQTSEIAARLPSSAKPAMINVLRRAQVFFTPSLLRPDAKHNAPDVKREDAQNVF
jgi:hypothetical protein